LDHPDFKGDVMLAQLEPLSRALEFARHRFTYGVSRVPEDRLNWSVGGSANTPLTVAAKAAGMIGFLGGALAARSMPERRGPAAPPASADEAIAAVNASFNTLQDALAGLTEADLALTLPAPWGGDMALPDWIAFGNQVIGYWQGQLNLIQLAYGDEEANLPPDIRA
jgi:hypothetical protein